MTILIGLLGCILAAIIGGVIGTTVGYFFWVWILEPILDWRDERRMAREYVTTGAGRPMSDQARADLEALLRAARTTREAAMTPAEIMRKAAAKIREIDQIDHDDIRSVRYAQVGFNDNAIGPGNALPLAVAALLDTEADYYETTDQMWGVGANVDDALTVAHLILEEDS